MQHARFNNQVKKKNNLCSKNLDSPSCSCYEYTGKKLFGFMEENSWKIIISRSINFELDYGTPLLPECWALKVLLICSVSIMHFLLFKCFQSNAKKCRASGEWLGNYYFASKLCSSYFCWLFSCCRFSKKIGGPTEGYF